MKKSHFLYCDISERFARRQVKSFLFDLMSQVTVFLGACVCVGIIRKGETWEMAQNVGPNLRLSLNEKN